MAHFRTAFISDTHLGTVGCQAEALHDFLSSNTFTKLYLAGDVIDFWALRRRSYWPDSHSAVLGALINLAHVGTQIVWVAGNHDEVLRNFLPFRFGDISVMDSDVHTAADGKAYLVVHGDEFDPVIRGAKWLAVLGDIGYTALLRLGTWLSLARRALGFPYWSLSAAVKGKVKAAVNFVGNYRDVVTLAAKRWGVQGVVCGHIHHAEITHFGDITYINTGDWVESCTAVVERADGEMQIVWWGTPLVSEERRQISDKGVVFA